MGGNKKCLGGDEKHLRWDVVIGGKGKAFWRE